MSEQTKEQKVQVLVDKGFITIALVTAFSKLSNDDLDAFLAEQEEFKTQQDEAIDAIETKDFSELTDEDKEGLYQTLKAQLYPGDELTSSFEKKYHEKVVECRQLNQKLAKVNLDKIKLAAETILKSLD